jgi:hypothetical protein
MLRRFGGWFFLRVVIEGKLKLACCKGLQKEISPIRTATLVHMQFDKVKCRELNWE